MSHHLIDNFNIASIGENSLAKKFIAYRLTVKTSIGLEKGGQVNHHVITQLILTQFYSLPCNNMIHT